MKIGIDISQIIYEGTGVARFTKGLTNAILDFDRKNSWIFFFSSLRRNIDPELEKKIIQKGHKLIKWRLPPTLLSFLFNDLHSLSKHLITNNHELYSLDWFISSDWIEIPLNVKKATIVHDLVYLRFPDIVDSKILETQKKRLNWVKQESTIIFADSQTTKNDLENLLKIGPQRIHINYPGVEIKKPTKEQINLTLKKYNLNRSFVLTVGKIEPRKNIKRLIEAFQKIKNQNIDLVIVGPQGWEKKQYNNITMKQFNIKFLGLITDTELYSLYNSCLFFIYPSLWEGFGYPVVEAMKLGVPVGTSNTSSLKEIAENAALLFNPDSVNEIYQSMETLIKDEKIGKVLSKKGLERSKIFTWLNYYKKLMSILSENY